MTVEKGNIVRSHRTNKSGIVLAIRKDGTRVKVYAYGPDVETWVPMEVFTVTIDGDDTCYKCNGSGIFYIAGATVNGVFQGSSGKCFACQGKGKQNNDDRLRNHYYWHRQSGTDDSYLPEGVTNDQPEPQAEPPAAKVKIKSKRRDPRSTVVQPTDALDHLKEAALIDCKGCGTMHRDDIGCPW